MQGGLYEKCTEVLFEQMHGVIKLVPAGTPGLI